MASFPAGFEVSPTCSPLPLKAAIKHFAIALTESLIEIHKQSDF